MTAAHAIRSLSVALALALAALCALPACSDERATPSATFDALRSAMEAGDGATVFALHDADTRAFRLQHIRTVRARLEQGEDLAAVLGHDRRQPEEFLEGTIEDVAARDVLTLSMLADGWERLRDAEVLEEEIEATDTGRPRRARLRVRYADDEEEDVYFLEEPSGWKLDQFRNFQVRTNAR